MNGRHLGWSNVRALFVVDASVLIDLRATEPGVLALISNHIGKIHVASTMLREEVPDSSPDECDSYSIRVVEPDLDLLRLATQKIDGLSFHDRVCMLLAAQHSWVCLTNDVKLRKECKRRSIAHQWGLEPVVELVTGGHYERDRARALITALQARSPGHYKQSVVDRFIKAIG